MLGQAAPAGPRGAAARCAMAQWYVCAAAGCVCGAHMPMGGMMGSQSALPEWPNHCAYRVLVIEWECKVKSIVYNPCSLGRLMHRV